MTTRRSNRQARGSPDLAADLPLHVLKPAQAMQSSKSIHWPPPVLDNQRPKPPGQTEIKQFSQHNTPTTTQHSLDAHQVITINCL